jgi:hypothetical protein
MLQRLETLFGVHLNEPGAVMASSFEIGFAHFGFTKAPATCEMVPSNSESKMRVPTDMLAAPLPISAIRSQREPAGSWVVCATGFDGEAFSIVRSATKVDPSGLRLARRRGREHGEHRRNRQGDAGPATWLESRPFRPDNPIHARQHSHYFGADVPAGAARSKPDSVFRGSRSKRLPEFGRASSLP